jgi:hypothetical protein
MKLVQNDLGLVLTDDGQWAIKEESPTLFVVRERTGPEVWDWRERARAGNMQAARMILSDVLNQRRV